MPDSFSGDDLTCLRGERVVFADLRFAVSAGGALVLRGANGSGKSSLLRLMAGFGRTLAGALKWNGENVAADCMAHRARLNYIGHADALKPALTARENLAFCTGLSGVEDAIDAALERLRLTALADVAGRFLSAGEKRRLALARFAAVPAPLWLLDEPTVGLDAQATAAFESLLAEHRAGGGLVVLSTHTVVALDDAETLDMTGYAIARAVFDQDAGR